jgi:hypothetical protein
MLLKMSLSLLTDRQRSSKLILTKSDIGDTDGTIVSVSPIAVDVS